MLRREKMAEVAGQPLPSDNQLTVTKKTQITRLTSRTPLVPGHDSEWERVQDAESSANRKPDYKERCRRCCLIAWVLDKFRGKSEPGKSV